MQRVVKQSDGGVVITADGGVITANGGVITADGGGITADGRVIKDHSEVTGTMGMISCSEQQSSAVSCSSPSLILSTTSFISITRRTLLPVSYTHLTLPTNREV